MKFTKKGWMKSKAITLKLYGLLCADNEREGHLFYVTQAFNQKRWNLNIDWKGYISSDFLCLWLMISLTFNGLDMASLQDWTLKEETRVDLYDMFSLKKYISLMKISQIKIALKTSFCLCYSFEVSGHDIGKHWCVIHTKSQFTGDFFPFSLFRNHQNFTILV